MYTNTHKCFENITVCKMINEVEHIRDNIRYEVSKFSFTSNS